VWQDVIPLGTANISQDPAFVERIYAEAVAAIRERRNHPCLIQIEGGEEAFLLASDPQFTNTFWRNWDDAFRSMWICPMFRSRP